MVQHQAAVFLIDGAALTGEGDVVTAGGFLCGAIEPGNNTDPRRVGIIPQDGFCHYANFINCM